MCTYSKPDHALPHLKCALRWCTKCPCVNLPDQETYDQYSNTTPSIWFNIYCLIENCTTHGRFLLNERKFFACVNRILIQNNPQNIYTRKDLVEIETTIYNFYSSFYILAIHKLVFHIPMYKYWVQITVVTLVKLRLNSENHFKMCYVSVIMLRG